MPTEKTAQIPPTSKTKKIFTERKIHLIVFLGALIFSSALLVILAILCKIHGQDIISTLIVFQKDSAEYASLATNLLHHGIYTQFPNLTPPLLELFRAPGYPVFIALVLFFYGTIFALPVIQLILHALTAVLIFEIGRRFFTRTAGLLAAVLYTLEPSAIHGFMLAMSDTLFQFLFVGMILLFLLSAENEYKKYRLNLAIGILVGLLALIRPIAQFFPLVLIAAITLHLLISQGYKDKTFLKHALFGIGTLVLACGLTLTPWLIRNHTQAGFNQISTISVFNIFYYNVPDYYAYTEGISKQEALTRQLAAINLTEATTNKNSPEQIGQMGKATREFFSHHAFSYIRFHLLKGTIFMTQSSLKTEYLFVKTQILQQPQKGSAPFANLFLHGEFRALSRLVFQSPAEILFLLERLAWVLMTFLSLLSLCHARFRRSIIPYLSLFIILYWWAGSPAW